MPNPIESRILAALFLAPMSLYRIAKALDVEESICNAGALGLIRGGLVDYKSKIGTNGWWTFYYELTESGHDKVQQMMGTM